MDRSTAFQPLWPPADEDDGFVQIPEVRQARRMYRAQKDQLRDLAEQAMRASVGADTNDQSHQIANMLHNIAGTAAHFDEPDLGLFAARLEQPVRNAFAAELLRPLSAEILARLGPRIEP